MNPSLIASPGVTPRRHRRAAVVGVAALACTLLLFASLFFGLILLAIAAGPFPYGTVGSPT